MLESLTLMLDKPWLAWLPPLPFYFLELLVGLQEWIKAFPNYSLDPAKKTLWANGQVRGPRNIPVLLNR